MSKKTNKYFMVMLCGLMFLSSFCNAMDRDNHSDDKGDKGKKLFTPGFRPTHEPERDEDVQEPSRDPLHFDVRRHEYYRGVPLSEVSAGGSSDTLVREDEGGAVYHLQKSQPLAPLARIKGYFDELDISEEQRAPFIRQFEHLDATERNIFLDTFKDSLSRLNTLKGRGEIFQEIKRLFSRAHK